MSHRSSIPTNSDINALVLEMRQAGTGSTYEIVKEAISRWAAPAAQAVEPAAYSGLHNVISWLEGGCDPKHAANELRLIALRAAPAPAAVAVPDGWKLVPVQDTQSMWTAGGRAIKSCAGHERDAASLAYKAMLAAAPALAATPPAQAQAAANTQEKTMPFNSPIYEGVRAAVQRDMHAGAAWHSDTVAVYRFADEMAAKMEQARAKGRGGWETCPPEVLSSMLREHVEKGDPRDVANFCMMLWHLGQPIAPAPQAQDVQRDAGVKPKPGRYVLAWMEGKSVPIRAMWVPELWLEAGDECPEDWATYSEEKDGYFCPEGWYEANEHEETHFKVNKPIVAWVELPSLDAAIAASAAQGEA